MSGRLEGDKCPWMDRMCGAFNGDRTLRTRQRSNALKLGRFLSWLVTPPAGNGRRGSGVGEANSGWVRCSQRTPVTRERFATRTRPFRAGFGRRRRVEVTTSWKVRGFGPHWYQALRLWQPESPLRWVTRVLLGNGRPWLSGNGGADRLSGRLGLIVGFRSRRRDRASWCVVGHVTPWRSGAGEVAGQPPLRWRLARDVRCRRPFRWVGAGRIRNSLYTGAASGPFRRLWRRR